MSDYTDKETQARIDQFKKDGGDSYFSQCFTGFTTTPHNSELAKETHDLLTSGAEKFVDKLNASE